MHGGVTKKDIEIFLEGAKDQAEENRSLDLDTVVFFDEVNTTDAIGLIKEIMCHRRLRGEPIPEDNDQKTTLCRPRVLCEGDRDTAETWQVKAVFVTYCHH